MTAETSNRKIYFPGFDYLRAALAIDATCFHVLFYVSRDRFALYKPELQDQLPLPEHIFSLNILFLAIPSFFTLSMFLFAWNQTLRPDYFKKRIWMLIQLYVFWFFVWFIYNLITNTSATLEEFTTLTDTLIYFVSGGQSLYWFFSTLIVITALLHFYLKFLTHVKRNRTAWMFAIFILSIAFVILATILIGHDHFANPIPFIPFVALIPILVHYVKNYHRNQPGIRYYGFIALCVILYMGSSVIEWKMQPWFAEQGFLVFVVPFYIRPSLLFGTIAIFLLALTYQKPVPKFMKFIAGFSLSIYCLHLYVPGRQEVFNFVYQITPFTKVPAEIVTLTYMIGGSILLAFLLRKIKAFRQFL